MNTRYSTHDEQLVQTVLSEAGLTGLPEAGAPQPDGLRQALLELRGFAHSSAPALSPQLAARADRGVIDLGRARHTRHRVGLASLAIVGAMGLGVGAAAAASPDFRDSAQQTVAGFVSTLAGPAAPSSPAAPDVSVAPPSAPPVTPVTPPAPRPAQPTTPADTRSNVGTPASAHDTHGRSAEAATPRKPAPPQLPALPEQAAPVTPGVPNRPGRTAQVPRSLHAPVSPAAGVPEGEPRVGRGTSGDGRGSR